MKKVSRKNKVQKVSKVFIILSIVSLAFFSILYVINYNIDASSISEENTTEIRYKATSEKKEVISALVCGINENLTDTIIYIRYNVKTGKIAMMSIPRDTYVDNEYCIGHKINAIYRGKNVVPLISEIENMLDVKIDYYLFFRADMLREMVDSYRFISRCSGIKW